MMKVLIVLLSTLVYSFQIVIQDGPSLRITNSSTVEPYSIPYQVFIYGTYVTQFELSYYGCGGVILTTRYILTTADCLIRLFDGVIYAGVNSPFNYEKENGTIRYIDGYQLKYSSSNLIIHDQFNDTSLENNIALINLQDEPLIFNERISAANLPRESDIDTDYTGQEGRISSWINHDQADDYNIDDPDVLQAVNVSVISNEECHAVYGDIRANELCLEGTSYKRACLGDQGGPLVIGNTVVGLISYRRVATCVSQYPTVITSIAPHLEWIQAYSSWVPSN